MGYLTVVFQVRSPARAVVFMIVQQRRLRLVAPSPEPCLCRTFLCRADLGGDGAARRHTFQVLTKRPKQLAVMLSDPGFAAEVAQHATDLIASRAWQRWQLDLGGQRLAGAAGPRIAIALILRLPHRLQPLGQRQRITAVTARRNLGRTRLSGST